MAAASVPLIRNAPISPFPASTHRGAGYENWFTEYEAFALLTGLRLMGHDWPQGLVVAALRRVKPDLERYYARILRQNPTILFDADQIRQQARPGDLAVGNTDPVFLVMQSKKREHDASANRAAICQGQAKLMDFIKTGGPGQTWTVTELGRQSTPSPRHWLKRRLANEAEGASRPKYRDV